MPAIPIGQCVRIRLAGGLAAAAVLVATAACTTATPGSSQNQSQSQRPSQSPVVTTADGAVRGKTVAATREFLGIPYAAPPVGALRWQPPQPPKPWSGIRAASSYAPHCPQSAGAFGRPSTSEDCLYLNVFTPAGAPGGAGRSTRNLPVMVWVHGGSLRTGESDDYNPAGLVRHGVIVVTLNYRIGALGFLASAALACHALTAEQSLSRYVPVYAYEFNDENAPELFLPPVGFPYGAAHASELQYLFSQTAVPHPASLSPAQQQLAAAMQQDWTSLARTGVPAPGWPRISRAGQQVLSLVPPQPRVERNFAAQHHCAFWAAAG
jgi:carboxylesterase type B